MSCSPPLPRSPRSQAHNLAAASPPAGPSYVALARPLNPDATPFSPSRAFEVATEELPEWLPFSPSSMEGRSYVGRWSITSPAPSFVDVVRGKGKAPMVTPPPATLDVCSDGWLHGRRLPLECRSACLSTANGRPVTTDPRRGWVASGLLPQAGTSSGHSSPTTSTATS
jgi:hypothetical protein